MQMHKKLMMTGLALGSLFAGVVLPNIVFAQGADRGAQAQERRAEAEVRTQQIRVDVDERKAEILERVEAKRAEVTEKLDQKRLEVCEKRASKINNIVTRSAASSERHLSVFQKIAERTQAFYADKQLTTDNYDQLVATVEEKEAEAAAAIEAAKEVTFDCAEQDAKKVGTTVRDLMKAQHAALKEYRTAIKDLIVGVKQAAKTAEETSEETTEQNTADQTEATEPEANQESQE